MCESGVAHKASKSRFFEEWNVCVKLKQKNIGYSIILNHLHSHTHTHSDVPPNILNSGNLTPPLFTNIVNWTKAFIYIVYYYNITILCAISIKISNRGRVGFNVNIYIILDIAAVRWV